MKDLGSNIAFLCSILRSRLKKPYDASLALCPKPHYTVIFDDGESTGRANPFSEEQIHVRETQAGQDR